MLQKKCTEMAKLADSEVMARSQVQKEMAATIKQKEELESDNRVLAERYRTASTQQDALELQLKTVTHEKMKLESDVKKKE